MLITFVAVSAAAKGGKLPLLTGKVQTTFPMLVHVSYDVEGEQIYDKLSTDAAGNFTISPDFPGNAVDIEFSIDENFYGARLEKGKQVRVDIKNGKATFTGANVAYNKFLGAMGAASQFTKYKPTPDRIWNYDDAKREMDLDFMAAEKALKSVTDPKLRKEGEALLASRRDLMHYFIINCAKGGDKYKNDAELILASVDVNSDAARKSGLLTYWFALRPSSSGQRIGTTEEFAKEDMVLADSLVTNPANLTRLYIETLKRFINPAYMEQSDREAFLKLIKPHLDKSPRTAAYCRGIFADSQRKEVADGDKMPLDPVVIDPAGKRIQLSEVIKGKVAYIDLWATWCGPCCAEIPALEKLVEEYKGNDKIVFVSISCDTNRKAWLKKLEKDNPQWPNFIFDGKTGDDFMGALKVNGIPRFILVDAQGNLVAVDAERPSSSTIKETINNLIK